MSVKFNPFTNTFDFVGGSGGVSSPDNFSYETILVSEEITLPARQQMILFGPLTVEGTFNAYGTVILL
jgi:hypothetical protein